eukprot:364308-Chlamydomonas_euryale.AAC.9
MPRTRAALHLQQLRHADEFPAGPARGAEVGVVRRPCIEFAGQKLQRAGRAAATPALSYLPPHSFVAASPAAAAACRVAKLLAARCTELPRAVLAALQRCQTVVGDGARRGGRGGVEPMVSCEYGEWVKASGIRLHNIAAAVVAHGWRGVVATAHIAPGDVLLEVPAAMLLSRRSAEAEPALMAVLQTQPGLTSEQVRNSIQSSRA